MYLIAINLEEWHLKPQLGMPAQLVEEVGGGLGVNAGLAVLILATIQLKLIKNI